ncbi:phenylalanine--tRNA ligase subunit beta [Candidatus Woesearchaeota archaeon]|jgi:phenylalanyl-tRNA synthetase beta chain|nr:phenylalanine--tRNA ligase subunit beta [Candidatus Woesearchaeota archaeon]MBT5273029.1 phenylalanine--tRNA ligase subunit beta [Candidatus Woesearchaeota archaeon]MBT6040835.1 phenylalanine--tRNA ligase subunit beta [Candidatus Woesearchaeota archaeon]MBT6337656.1 phenylalanine--tRNA ligase subunit beta [Candidatus Woesearchaeota archaeon]MBT7926943.1 phenylalanine--tRNA ligase subunit beta [Candidatus Woesearchaeota archaeon]
MPTVTLNKNVFEKLVGKKLPIEKLKERISMLGTDLESIEGNEIQVEIFPNRPDMLSEQGFARAFSSFIGVKTGLKKYKIKKSGHKVIVGKGMEKIRPYTVCAIVRNLKFDDEKIREVIQVQEKLHTTFCRNRKKAAIGIYPLENIKLPIYFKAMNPKEIKFRPLEAKKEMTGLQILSQHPTGRDYGHLVEGLNKFAVFMDSNNEIMSLTPIINSHLTGKVNEKTTDIFIEFSGYDLEYQKIGLNMLAALFSDMGGQVESMEIVYPDKTITTPNLEPTKMKIDVEYVNKKIGLNLKEKEMKTYMERMGLGYEAGKALVPAYRADIMHPVDIAEDIAIAFGFENFEEEIPKVSTIGEEDSFEVFKRRVANILVGLGLIETCSYHLINKDDQTTKMNTKLELVKLSNPTTEEYNTLRQWMTPCLMNVFKHNRQHEYPQKIFDMGVAFKKNKNTETNVEEFTRVGVGISQPNTDYTEIKQILDYLLRMLDVKYEIIEYEHESFISGRVGRAIVKGKKVAVVGEIHPQILSNFDLDMPVAVFELNLTQLFELIREKN